MLKKILGISAVALILCSCQTKKDIDTSTMYYDKLSRDQNIKDISYKKGTYSVSGIKYLLANYPDKTFVIAGDGFEHRYDLFAKYLESNGYTILSNYKFGMIGTMVAKINKPDSKINDIGVSLEQDKRNGVTNVSIVYGGDKRKATQLFNDYKAELDIADAKAAKAAEEARAIAQAKQAEIANAAKQAKRLQERKEAMNASS